MKKVICLFLTVLLCSCLLCSCLDTGTGDQGSGSAGGGTGDPTALGDYSVVIDSCRLSTSWDDEPIIIVKYVFTNNGEDSASFFSSLNDKAYQNGVGLNRCYTAIDSANYSEDNQTKDIKKGASLEVEVAYRLNDTTTDVEIEVSEFISFSDKKITKTFSIK